jgi:hypothetical protein
MLVPSRGRDGVLGDLLEEYRESVLPQRGKASADWWYVRHAAGFLWRAALPWAIGVGLILSLRDVIDATVPTTDNFHFRAVVCTYLAFTTYISAGLSTGWRTGRTAAGLVVSFAMTAIAIGMGVLTALALSMLVSAGAFQTAPTYLRLSEDLDIPILPMLIVGGALATIGAAIGRAGRRFPRIDVA